VRKSKIVALSFLGIIVPVALAFTAFLISRNTIGSAGTVPSLTHPAQTAEPTESPTPKPLATRNQDGKQGSNSGPGSAPAPQVTASSPDDHGGRCSEPEHLNDAECNGDDSSGKGSGDGDNSGHGGGDD
jgi:hypothetical protein